MEFTQKIERTMNVTHLIAEMGVRYWEDAKVNGVEDADGTLIPLRIGDVWRICVDLETGKIKDWPDGVEASIHYKVADDGNYLLISDCGEEIISRDGYVPSMLCPKENGYGDYVIMQIGGDGVISGFSADLGYFEDEE